MGASRAVIPGMHRVTKRLSGDRFAIYIYAYRGGPLLMRFSGANLKAAMAAERAGAHDLVRAHASLKAPQRKGTTLRDLVQLFREVPEGLRALAPSTAREWSRWLDRIVVDLGDFPLRAISGKGVKRDFIEWRDKFASTPRQADYGIQVLRRVLSVGVEREVIEANPAEGIKQLYRSNRADVVLTDEELAAVLARVTPRARYAIRLAAATGLRRGDLVDLRWDQVYANRIELDTGKSRGRTSVIAPLAGDGAAVIEELRRERERQIADGGVPSAFVLITERGTAWRGPSLTQAFIRGGERGGGVKSSARPAGDCGNALHLGRI